MGMMRYFHANICFASFSSLSTLHLTGVLISSLEQRGALRTLAPCSFLLEWCCR